MRSHPKDYAAKRSSDGSRERESPQMRIKMADAAEDLAMLRDYLQRSTGDVAISKLDVRQVGARVYVEESGVGKLCMAPLPPYCGQVVSVSSAGHYSMASGPVPYYFDAVDKLPPPGVGDGGQFLPQHPLWRHAPLPC